jgi:hypothetical protein
VQQGKFKKLIQKVNMKYLGKDAADNQKIAMQRGELQCDNCDYDKVAERLFKINRDLELLGKDIEGFSIQEMAKHIIPQNLKYQAKIKYIDKDGKNLHHEEGIIDLCRSIKEVLDNEYNYHQKEKSCNGKGPRGSTQNNLSAEEREKCDSAKCQKHDGAHKWKDCLEIWHNKEPHHFQ